MKMDKSVHRKKVLLAVLVLAVLGVAFSVGLIPGRSGLRLGFVETSFGRNWKVSYLSYSGIREKKIISNHMEHLNMQVTTDQGEIAVEVKDRDGNVLFSEEHMKSMEREIAVKGTAKIRVVTKGHKGGFQFRW